MINRRSIRRCRTATNRLEEVKLLEEIEEDDDEIIEEVLEEILLLLQAVNSITSGKRIYLVFLFIF